MSKSYSRKSFISLKRLAREGLAFFFRFSGLALLIRWALAKRKVTFIFYHDPSVGVLRRHLEYLKKRYNFISLAEYIDSRENSFSLPPYAMVVSLDDGHKGNYALMNLFREYELCPTIYLTSEVVGTDNPFWFMTSGIDLEKLKSLTNRERLSALDKYISESSSGENVRERQALSYEEIEEMREIVDFQAHSCTHPVLTECDDLECAREIKESKSQLQAVLLKSVSHFAYPNGDYTEREINFLKEAGYQTARTLDIGWNDETTSPYCLKAMGVEDNASVNVMVAQVSGIFGYLRCLKHGRFDGKLKPRIL
jgi:peptidoglycan/xylan/chitin deacetylase (PgdA/CDA1 family)